MKKGIYSSTAEESVQFNNLIPLLDTKSLNPATLHPHCIKNKPLTSVEQPEGQTPLKFSRGSMFDTEESEAYPSSPLRSLSEGRGL